MSLPIHSMLSDYLFSVFVKIFLVVVVLHAYNYQNTACCHIICYLYLSRYFLLSWYLLHTIPKIHVVILLVVCLCQAIPLCSSACCVPLPRYSMLSYYLLSVFVKIFLVVVVFTVYRSQDTTCCHITCCLSLSRHSLL